MDRSRVNTRTENSDYYEVSTRDPEYWLAKKEKRKLPLHSYVWDSHKAFSTMSAIGVTDFDAAGFDTFANFIKTGYYGCMVGNDYVRCKTLQQYKALLENDLLQKATAEPINLGIAIGEYKETAKMFRDVVSKATEELEGVRKHSYHHAWLYVNNRYIEKALLRKARAAAQAWLTFSYALKPFISDLLGGAEALAISNGTKDYCDIKTVRSRIVPEVIGGRSSFQEGSTAVHADVKGMVLGNCRIDYQCDNPLYKTAVALGLWGSTNAAQVAWELIPWSFVFDWFIPVGDYLQALRAPEGVSSAVGFCTFKARGRSQRSSLFLNRWPPWNTSFRETSLVKRRWIYHDFPAPHLIVPDLSLSKAQMASAVSLYFAKAKNLTP